MLKLVLTITLLTLPASATHPDEHGPKPIAPAEALTRLKDGNARYVADMPLTPDVTKHRREEVATGQHPFAIVVACADSRLPPELIFNQGLGDLFVVREAGNGVDAHGAASIEYAIEHLGARLIVIMGHTSCGAVKAALAAKPGVSSGSPSLDTLVADVNHCMEADVLSDADRADPQVRAAARANVKGNIQVLLKTSKIVRERVEHGELAIVGGLYDLTTGAVELWASQEELSGRH